MAMNDTLAAALSTVLNADTIGKPQCVVSPVSKITLAILEIMKMQHYIGEFTSVDDGRGGYIEITLIGGVNKCGVIKPRFSVNLQNFDRYEKRFLPAKNFGLLILSTSQGIMTQDQAKEKKIGGKLLAYVY